MSVSLPVGFGTAAAPESSGDCWLFTGEQRDSEYSFYYRWARYYDPNIGRFLGRDPLKREARPYSGPRSSAWFASRSARLFSSLGIDRASNEANRHCRSFTRPNSRRSAGLRTL